MTQEKIKVLMVGPVKSGKTVISTFLSDSPSEIQKFDYKPTQGVRIIGFEIEDYHEEDEESKKEPFIELWDCSGDRRFEKCWPAMRRFTDALILVCNPATTKGNELSIWQSEFIQKIGLKPDQVLVLLHHTSENTNDSAIAEFKLPQDMYGIKCVPVNVDKDGDLLKREFTSFLNKIKDQLDTF